MSDVFSVYTPDVPENAPTPCMRDPIRLFDIVFLLSIVVWFPYKWWNRGSILHTAWLAALFGIFVVHIVWLMTANAAGQPSEDTWEYATAIGSFFVALIMITVIPVLLPFAVAGVCGFYGLMFVFSLNIHQKDVMTALLVTLLVLDISTIPVTFYVLKTQVAETIKDLLDLAFRTVVAVAAIKFWIVQEAEWDGTVCCTIDRSWHLTTNCPLSLSVLLLIVCLAIVLLRIAWDVRSWWMKSDRTVELKKRYRRPLIDKRETEEEEGKSEDE
jgi:uncharacterized membrane protein